MTQVIALLCSSDKCKTFYSIMYQVFTLLEANEISADVFLISFEDSKSQSQQDRIVKGFKRYGFSVQ